MKDNLHKILLCSGVDKLWEKVVPDIEDQEWDPENTDKYS